MKTLYMTRVEIFLKNCRILKNDLEQLVIFMEENFRIPISHHQQNKAQSTKDWNMKNKTRSFKKEYRGTWLIRRKDFLEQNTVLTLMWKTDVCILDFKTVPQKIPQSRKLATDYE